MSSNEGVTVATDSIVAGYKAVEVLYHNFLTGLILRTVMLRGAKDAEELVFRLFRRQQQRTFLPGLKKLGLTELPDVVACGQYHYLSNAVGGVKVEYMYESDRKVWVRYPPPRWIWDGTAACGIPTEVSRAMMRGWHAHNGVSLDNPRLGWVCTKQTVDGQPGLEGYYYEYDHDLTPDERLRFAPGEESPEFDPANAPKLDSDTWPEERLRKVLRNYSMEYVRNILPVMAEVFGPAEAANLGRTAGKIVGMQFYDQTAAMLDVTPGSPEAFSDYLVQMGVAQDDVLETQSTEDGACVRQTTWKLFGDVDDLSPSVFEAWNALWEGALAVHNRRLTLDITKRLDRGENCFEWRIRPMA